MLEIPVLVLVLQIGIHAALNNGGYISNPLIPSARSVHSGQTRRAPDTAGDQSSRGLSESDEQSDSEYTSYEDYSFRSVRPLISHPNQRRNVHLRYGTRPENDVSLELPPLGRIVPNKYVDGLLTSSSSSRRKNANFRRPYLRLKPSNVDQNRNYYRKSNDDASLEVPSLESSNPDEEYRLGEEASYLRSLLSLVDEPYYRRHQNRKYYRDGNNLSFDVSPTDKLELDEDAVDSLPNYKTHKYRKEYDDHHYDLGSLETPEKDIPDEYIDSVLLVTDDDQTDEIPIVRKLESPNRKSLRYNKFYNRRPGDGINLDDDISNDLSSFLKLKPRLRSSLSQNSRTRKLNRISNDNAVLESLLNDELLSDGDKVEDLNIESLLLRSRDQKKHNNRKSNRRKFLRLSLSPNNKLTLDKSVASDLSELLSGNLDELKLVPVNFRRAGLSSNKYSIRKNNKLSGEDNLNNRSVLRLGSVDIPNAESPLRRYRKRLNRSRRKILRDRRNNKKALKEIFDDDNKNLVPDYEVKSNKLPDNRRHGKQYDNRRDDFPDEFNLDTLFEFRKEDHDDELDLANQDNLNLEIPPYLRNFNENESKQKDTTDVLHLEYPWNDQLSPNGASQLRSRDQKDDTKDSTDELHLEYPWIDQLSPNGTSQLRSRDQKDDIKDSTDVLHLEYPWNDQLSPNGASQLRSRDQKDETKDSTDVLHLEYPWNDQLSPNGASQLRSRDQKDETKDSTDVLHLEYPWNDQLSPNGTSQLRSRDQKDDTKDSTDVLHLEYPWNDQLSPNGTSQLRSRDQSHNTKDSTDVLHLEYPWNDQLSPHEDSKLKRRKQADKITDSTNILHPEYPWSDQISTNRKSRLRNGEQADKTIDTLNLELPWNDPLSSNGNIGRSRFLLRTRTDRQDKESKEELKLELPWPSPPKPSSTQVAARTPDPFFVHPYLRNQNIHKHPNHFRRSYAEFTEGARLRNLKDSPSHLHLRRSSRTLNGNQSLLVPPAAGGGPQNGTILVKDSDGDTGNSSILLLDRRPQRLRSHAEGTPMLVTTTETNTVGDKKLYNDTIIFPNN